MPKPGATGLCMHYIAKELAYRGHDVTTICYSDGDNKDIIDGVKIERIPVPTYIYDNSSGDGLKGGYIKWASRFSKLIYIWKYPLRSKKLIREYIEAVKKCLLFGDKDAIVIASYTPLEAVAALPKIKKMFTDVKIVYYSADTLSNEQGNGGILPAKYRESSGKKWENELFSVCDKIMIMECHKEHYNIDIYAKFYNKMQVVNFPLLTNKHKEKELVIDKRKKIEIVYAGTLYKVLRNPTYTCELMTKVLKEIDLELFFLGGGDCEDILNNAANLSNGAIKYLGMQPYKVAEDYIKKADVLLSIGNAESPMAPSKIIEYIATGKPIIHIYSWDKDPCLEPLKKYGNALLIKEKDVEGPRKVIRFLEGLKTISFEEVYEKFITSTPQYSADVIEELL